jgi:hypothetical protein
MSENTVQLMLEKYQYAPLEIDAFCEELKFTNEEMFYKELFWKPAFNKGLLYLARELIQEWFPKKNGTRYNKFDVRNFYETKMKKDFKEGSDYNELKSNDPLIIKYKKLIKRQHPGSKIKKYANGTKFYAITGKCFKKNVRHVGWH